MCDKNDDKIISGLSRWTKPVIYKTATSHRLWVKTSFEIGDKLRLNRSVKHDCLTCVFYFFSVFFDRDHVQRVNHDSLITSSKQWQWVNRNWKKKYKYTAACIFLPMAKFSQRNCNNNNTKAYNQMNLICAQNSARNVWFI